VSEAYKTEHSFHDEQSMESMFKKYLLEKAFKDLLDDDDEDDMIGGG
jgi:hypothetical protein